MDFDAYLERIGLQRHGAPNLATLRDLHRAHLLHVPFENLDIGRSREISLDPAHLFAKIVRRRRGGFCYELNALFSEFLGALGFHVDRLAARVMNASGELGPPYDHMTLRVRLEDDWLADVGFGDSFVEPLRLEVDYVQPQGGWEYRITHAEDALALQRRQPGASWATMYVFDLQQHAIADYENTCRYHQTSPESPFTKGDLCTLLTPSGRITLSRGRWIETRGDGRVEREIDPTEFDARLRDHFGIEIDAQP